MSFTTRPASLEDVPALAAVHVASWKAAYRGLIDERTLDSLVPEARLGLWERVIPDADADVFVTELGDQIAGFVAVRPLSEDPSMAWVPAIYVRPEHWRQGHGGALMQEAIRAARERGCRSLFLWVLEGNSTARRFYETQGLRFDGASNLDSTTGGKPLRELRYSTRLEPTSLSASANSAS